MWPYIIATFVFLAATLFAEARGNRPLLWTAKPLASTSFIAAAIAAGALDSNYGIAILVALVLSWWGDVLLIPRSKGAFRAGLVAFLLGHLAYAAAFFVLGIDPLWGVLALVVVIAPALIVERWLRPHVTPDMKVPVRAYIVIISLMVAASLGAVAAGAPAAVPVGAVMFWLSDIAVARQRFVSQSILNRLWGLPLYYGAQLVLAWTILL